MLYIFRPLDFEALLSSTLNLLKELTDASPPAKSFWWKTPKEKAIKHRI